MRDVPRIGYYTLKEQTRCKHRIRFEEMENETDPLKRPFEMDANESEKNLNVHIFKYFFFVFLCCECQIFLCVCCLHEYEHQTIVVSVDSVFLAQHFLFHILILRTVMAFLCLRLHSLFRSRI